MRAAIAAIAATSFLAACGTRQPTAPEPEAPAASAHNTVVMPPVVYGTTDSGARLSKADDTCGVSDSLRQALEDQLEAPYEYVLPERGPGTGSAALLKVEITDMLERRRDVRRAQDRADSRDPRPPRDPAAQFTAQRQMFMYFGLPKSTCSMVGNVTYALGGDIMRWLHQPIDGARLGDL